MTGYDDIATRRIERISGLSDALFAIAMTIIVLEIHVPDPATVHTNEQLWDALGGLVPQLLVYAASFLTLGIFWNAQQTQLNQFAQSGSQSHLDPPRVPGPCRDDAVLDPPPEHVRNAPGSP